MEGGRADHGTMLPKWRKSRGGTPVRAAGSLLLLRPMPNGTICTRRHHYRQLLQLFAKLRSRSGQRCGAPTGDLVTIRDGHWIFFLAVSGQIRVATDNGVHSDRSGVTA